MIRTEVILGYPVTAVALDACIDGLLKRMDVATKPFWLACLNPHSVRVAAADPSAVVALKGADVLIPDGAGIVLASRILGGGIRERITGSDIFREVSRRLNGQGRASCFFLGSTEETLAAIERRMRLEFPGIRFAGAYSPPFAEVFIEAQNRAMIEAVNRASPDVLWVGMTAPKQEKWIHANKDKLNVKFIAAVGAVFDFYAGNVKRSHPWFLEHGLEWLPRLFQEPRRLWQRTVISAPIFLWRVARQALSAPKRR
jgi:N-acetylglucosaminyldiphosphoundecaprenol N-acetyl-beta-D-mannosaminyltransferase